MPSKISPSVAKFSKQKLIPAVIVDVLGAYCSVRLSGIGKQLNALRYYGPIPVRGDNVQVNYQTGTPYVQTQTISIVEEEPLFIYPADQNKILPARYTKTYTWTPTSLAVGGILGPRLKEEQLIIRVDGVCVGGVSVTFNIEKRTSPNVAGTEIMASDMVAVPTGTSQIIFDVEAIAADQWIWLAIKGKAGSPTQFAATLTTVVKL